MYIIEYYRIFISFTITIIIKQRQIRNILHLKFLIFKNNENK